MRIQFIYKIILTSISSFLFINNGTAQKGTMPEDFAIEYEMKDSIHEKKEYYFISKDKAFYVLSTFRRISNSEYNMPSFYSAIPLRITLLELNELYGMIEKYNFYKIETKETSTILNSTKISLKAGSEKNLYTVYSGGKWIVLDVYKEDFYNLNKELASFIKRKIETPTKH